MKPSEITERHWLYESISFSFCSTYRSGKWLIGLTLEELDEAWEKVSEALHDRRLGPAAKASTATKNLTQVDFQQKMIVVYVDDYAIEEKNLTVLKELRALGFKGTLKFKRDLETYRGTYGKNSFWMYSRINTNVVRYKWTKELQKCVSQ